MGGPPVIVTTPGTRLPVGWEASAAPGATHVVVEAFAPGAFTSGEVALIGVNLFGQGLMVLLLVLLLLRRNAVGGRG